MVETLFRKSILERGLIKKNETLLLGVSGGPDSMAMLHMFARVASELKLRLIACHFNHMLREEAKEEESFVKSICVRYSLDCVCGKKQVKDFFDGDSLEQMARRLRYDFFLNCARSKKIKKIALAHHKDDLAETVLMRIIRGCGIKGLRAILPVTKYKNITLIRPFLDFTKDELVQWLEKNKFSFCIDKSNFEDDFLRNKIRSRLIPMLKDINPAIADSLANLAHCAALDYSYIEEKACSDFKMVVRKETASSIELALKEIKGLSLGGFSAVIFMAINQLKGNTRRIESRHIDEVYELVHKRPDGSVVDLPDIIFKKAATRLVAQKKFIAHSY